jgi:hypothetical protein
MAQTHHKGEIAKFAVLKRASEKELLVSLPTTEGSRYDMILDCSGVLSRAQIKYTTKKGSVWPVHLQKKSNSKSADYRCYTEDEIDILLVYLPEIDQVVALGKEHFTKRGVQIRNSPTKNGQTKGIINVSGYLW